MYKLVLKKIIQKNSVNKLALRRNRDCHTAQSQAGFTLVEFLAVVVMVGILAAIAAPNWIAFVNRQRVSKTSDIVLAGIQEAQREAKRNKLSYSVSFRNKDNIPQIVVHPKDRTPTDENWKVRGQNLEIAPKQIVIGTNLTGDNQTTSSTPVTYGSTTPQTITFDYTGALDLSVKTKTEGLTSVQNSKLGTKGLIVSVAVAKPGNPTQAGSIKRCVVIKTLLGSIRTANESEKDSGGNNICGS
jgi:prepilin-type N-terminal cleavage/methylation domain-containing protein